MLKKNLLTKLSNINIFFLSILICILFFTLEGIIGIDRFYHPDSAHYLQKKAGDVGFFFEVISRDPLRLFPNGYYYVARLFDLNYYLLIGLNFILYSITNVFLYEKIYKVFCRDASQTKSVILFYLLFLDPYRLHLTCHVLKETILIFIFASLIIYNNKIFRLIMIILLEYFRANSFMYLLVFFRFSFLKEKLFLLKEKLKLYNIRFLFTKIFFLTFVCISVIIILFSENISNFLLELLLRVKEIHFNEMPQRNYDKISNFQNYDFFIGFILKNITWPLGLLTGIFILFTTSFLFKILGILILLNHCLVYYLTKKTFVSLGLFLIILLISIYSSSYTAMFRYSYLGIYSGLILFFYNMVNKNE